MAKFVPWKPGEPGTLQLVKGETVFKVLKGLRICFVKFSFRNLPIQCFAWRTSEGEIGTEYDPRGWTKAEMAQIAEFAECLDDILPCGHRPTDRVYPDVGQPYCGGCAEVERQIALYQAEKESSRKGAEAQRGM